MQEPYKTTILDVRSDGHQSLSVIPRFMEGDFSRLQEHWKFEILFDHGHDRVNPGDLFWGISAIEVKAGPAVLQPQVRDINGNLITVSPGILLFEHFSSAPTLPPLDPPIDPQYFPNAVAGFTEGNGSIGWGFGGESFINAADPSSHNGGPFSVWASSDPVTKPVNRVAGSDCLSKIGWWDDHIIINPIFQIMRKAGSVPPVDGDYRLDVVINGAKVGVIPIQSGVAGGDGYLELFEGSSSLGIVKIE